MGFRGCSRTPPGSTGLPGAIRRERSESRRDAGHGWPAPSPWGRHTNKARLNSRAFLILPLRQQQIRSDPAGAVRGYYSSPASSISSPASCTSFPAPSSVLQPVRKSGIASRIAVKIRYCTSRLLGRCATSVDRPRIPARQPHREVGSRRYQPDILAVGSSEPESGISTSSMQSRKAWTDRDQWYLCVAR